MLTPHISYQEATKAGDPFDLLAQTERLAFRKGEWA
jgi:hypothetical protein